MTALTFEMALMKKRGENIVPSETSTGILTEILMICLGNQEVYFCNFSYSRLNTFRKVLFFIIN